MIPLFMYKNCMYFDELVEYIKLMIKYKFVETLHD